MKPVVIIALIFALTTSAVADSPIIRQPLCPGLLSSAPVGNLELSTRHSGGSTGGQWYRDQLGTFWFVKKDARHSDLQTSAEVVSASIYRHFGYSTPDTIKIVDHEVRYSAAKEIVGSHHPTDLSGEESALIRRMRFIAAFLKDWDRLGNRLNNLKFDDGTVAFIDFGGTLGARAQGAHKPGASFSDAIGAFEATENIDLIYGAFRVSPATTHPWMKVTRSDALRSIEDFKALSDEKITTIVKNAQYERLEDQEYMIHALMKRRDGIILGLLRYFPESVDASQIPRELSLAFEKIPFRGEIPPELYKTYDSRVLGEAIVEWVRKSEYMMAPNAKTFAVDFADHSQIMLHFKPENAEGIFRDGRIKNQHETLRSNSTYNPGQRVASEDGTTGLQLGSFPEADLLRPKSAFLNITENHYIGNFMNEVWRTYGKVAAVMKSGVKRRTLWVSDNNLTWGHIKRDEAALNNFRGTFSRLGIPPTSQAFTPDYVEALVYGKLSVEDIDHLVVFDDSAADALKTFDLPIFLVKSTRIHNRFVVTYDSLLYRGQGVPTSLPPDSWERFKTAFSQNP